jgi:hypothetical protein
MSTNPNTKDSSKDGSWNTLCDGPSSLPVSNGMPQGLPLITAQIVAGLSFGFWVGLLQPKYNPALWSSHLRVAFPHLPATETRVTLFKYAGDVATLRNRISHHEPIFKRDLLLDFGELMKLLAWICPDTGAWIRPHCQVPALMRSKP